MHIYVDQQFMNQRVSKTDIDVNSPHRPPAHIGLMRLGGVRLAKETPAMAETPGLNVQFTFALAIRGHRFRLMNTPSSPPPPSWRFLYLGPLEDHSVSCQGRMFFAQWHHSRFMDLLGFSEL